MAGTRKETRGMTRREFGKVLGAAGLAAAGTGLLPGLSRAADRGYILVGHPMASTGPLSPFGATAAFAENICGKEVNKDGGIYIKELDKKLPVKFKPLDSESNPTKAAEIATRLILQDKVDIITVASTPDTTNPVAAVCERYGVPCVCGVPYESWAPGGPYKWTFNMFWTVDQMADLFVGMWNEFADQTDKVVGGIWPNDPDGAALAKVIPEKLRAAGYKVVDVGRHPYGMPDYTAFIDTWKKEKVDILTGSPVPPDFASLWRQCKQLGYHPKIATIAKACLFPSAVEALGGNLAQGISSEIWWTPMHPFKSSLSGISCLELADAWTASTKKQWTQPLGLDYALIEVVIDILKRASSLNKDKLKAAAASTDLETVFGRIKFDKNQYAKTPLVGGQWVKSKGGKFPWDLEITYNKMAPEIPTTAKAIFPIPA